MGQMKKMNMTLMMDDMGEAPSLLKDKEILAAIALGPSAPPTSSSLAYVTLATDGSVSQSRRRDGAPDTRDRAGMAYYIRDDSGTTRHAWRVEGKHSSDQAEWLALEAAIEVIANRTYPPNTKLIFYCDNLTMIRLVENNFQTKRAKKNWDARAIWVNHKLAGFSQIECRHVKGHTKKDDLKRYYLNRWCDYNARSMMRHNRLHQYRKGK